MHTCIHKFLHTQTHTQTHIIEKYNYLAHNKYN